MEFGLPQPNSLAASSNPIYPLIFCLKSLHYLCIAQIRLRTENFVSVQTGLLPPSRQTPERPPRDSARTPSRNRERSTPVRVPGTFGQHGAPEGLKNQGRLSRGRDPRLRLPG